MPTLRSALPMLLVALAALVAYANAGSDALVLDDKLFTGHERFSDLSRVPDYFRESAWETSGVNEPLYRPLLMVSATLDARLFGDDYSAWHRTNVILHAVVSVLVYLLLLQWLRRSGSGAPADSFVAVLAALVFAVHPVHSEVVNSLFNRSVLIAAVGCVGGLWWLLRFVDTRPALAWAGIWLAYWLALFGRETGIVLPALAVTLLWLHSDDTAVRKLRRCMPVLLMALPAAVYLALRAQAIATGLPDGEEARLGADAVDEAIASAGLFDWAALRAAAGAWMDSLRLALWPHPLMVYHSRLPEMLQAIGLLLHLALLGMAVWLWRRGRPGLLGGLAFWYIALLPSSRLIASDGALAITAERFLYLPSVGLAALLAFGLSLLHRRVDRLSAAAPVVLALLLLTPLTWARNADWASEVRLLEQDYRNGSRTRAMLRLLTAAHLLQHNPARAVELCSAHSELAESTGQIANHCGTAWALTGDPDRAERAFIEATRVEDARARAHSNLARLYLGQGRRAEARAQFELAVESEENTATRAYRRGLMQVQLHPGERAHLLEARAHFEEALRLQPGHQLATAGLQQLQSRLSALPADDSPERAPGD